MAYLKPWHVGMVVLVFLLIVGLFAWQQINSDSPQDTIPESSMDAWERAEAGIKQNTAWIPHTALIDGVEMVLVPTGCFMMGNDTGQTDEQPVNEQCFDQPFWIDKYEVSNEQFGSVGCIQRSSDPDQPRNCVDWFAANAHCAARGARLPTEAEWEYAARGPDNLIYPWGNEFDTAKAVYAANADNKTAQVGSRPEGASWVGALDMSGNLWEWVVSIYQEYPYQANDGREKVNNSGNRVLRGGSWRDFTNRIYATNRGWGIQWAVDYQIGFRCAK